MGLLLTGSRVSRVPQRACTSELGGTVAATPPKKNWSPLPGVCVSADESGIRTGLVDLESDRSREFSLLLIEAVKAVRSKFEGRSDVQQVRSAGPQASRGLSGQLAGSFKDLLWKRAQQQDPVAQIFLEVSQGRLHLRS